MGVYIHGWYLDLAVIGVQVEGLPLIHHLDALVLGCSSDHIMSLPPFDCCGGLFGPMTQGFVSQNTTVGRCPGWLPSISWAALWFSSVDIPSPSSRRRVNPEICVSSEDPLENLY